LLVLVSSFPTSREDKEEEVVLVVVPLLNLVPVPIDLLDEMNDDSDDDKEDDKEEVKDEEDKKEASATALPPLMMNTLLRSDIIVI